MNWLPFFNAREYKRPKLQQTEPTQWPLDVYFVSTTCPLCLIFFHFFVWERKQIRAMRNSGQLHQVAPPAPLHCPEPISISISDPGFGGSYTSLGLSVIDTVYYYRHHGAHVVCSLNIYDKCIAYSQSCSYTFNPNKSLFRQKKALPMKHFIFEVILIIF